MVSIDGYYDKGKSRQNRAEAQAVVDEIARRLRSEELRRKSIGVVTFSVVQQALIEDLCYPTSFIFSPRTGNSCAGMRRTVMFIKNLENVQGDERDVILFLCRAMVGCEGRVSMNFGPLNRSRRRKATECSRFPCPV